MARESALDKARRYLTEGRLTVHLVNDEQIRAKCKGDGALYSLGYERSAGWHCDCEVRTAECTHLRALRFVTVRNHR